MDSRCFSLRDPAFPYTFQCIIQLLFWPSTHDFRDKGDVLIIRENKSELLIRGGEDVIDGIFSSIYYLNVLHILQPMQSMQCPLLADSGQLDSAGRGLIEHDLASPPAFL